MAMFRRNRPPAAGQPAQYGPPTGQPVAVGGGPGSGPGVPPGAVGGAAGPGGPASGPGGDLRQMLAGAPVDRVRLDLRLVVTRPGPHLAPPAMVWPLGDELVAVACVKLPDGQIVTAEVPMAQAWGMGAEDVWLQSATNLRGEHFTRSEFDAPGGADMYAFIGQGWPATAQLTRLGEALGADLPAGALVAFPDDNTLISVPIRNQRIPETVSAMFATGHELTRGMPPLSPRAYWWHEGVAEPLDVQWHGQQAHVNGSARFGQVMAGVPQR
jgi:hypothetical protein